MYMRDNLEDKYGILELQDKILEIAVDIDAICNKYGIEYCLMGGSALGAKRHKGFIPWDDDLDIFMKPQEYEKFRLLYFKYGDKNKYYLQEWGRINGMVTISKIRMNNTAFIEESLRRWNIHHGIYIDIFILHACPNSKLLQLRQCFWGKYAITKGLALRDHARHKGVRGLVIRLAKLTPSKFCIKHALNVVYSYKEINTNYYCNFLGKAVFKKGIYKREWFDNPVYTPFEKVKLKIPGGVDVFLTERFGNYMKIPTEAQIRYEQHAEQWSTKQDFREILKRRIDSYSDETLLI